MLESHPHIRSIDSYSNSICRNDHRRNIERNIEERSLSPLELLSIDTLDRKIETT